MKMNSLTGSSTIGRMLLTVSTTFFSFKQLATNAIPITPACRCFQSTGKDRIELFLVCRSWPLFLPSVLLRNSFNPDCPRNFFLNHSTQCHSDQHDSRQTRLFYRRQGSKSNHEWAFSQCAAAWKERRHQKWEHWWYQQAHSLQHAPNWKKWQLRKPIL